MKRLILIVASLAAVLVTGPVFARADYRPNTNLAPENERRLDQGLQVRFEGTVRRIDMREGELWLRKLDGGMLDLKAPREKLSRLAPGDIIAVAVERTPNGVDHVVRMWRQMGERKGLRFEEMP
ncbi:MAG: hypothetical protein WA666_03645 [Nitrospirota bacterium]